MSATQSPSSDSHHSPDVSATFHRLVDKLIRDKRLCAWCFARRRRVYEVYDAARDEYVRHSTLQVLTATSDPEPSTFSEVVPPKTDEERPWEIIEPARPRCICGDCALIDVDLDHDRSVSELIKAARNMCDFINEEHDMDLCPDAAADGVRGLANEGRVGGEDRNTLAYGLRSGFRGKS